MKTSARNHFTGTVSSVRAGAIHDEIVLEIDGGLQVVATVTRESRESLGIEAGRPAFALVKASSILLVAEAADVRLSARNQLAGTIDTVVPGAIHTEVGIVLSGGGGASVVAVVTNDSAEALGLAAGLPVTAVFKASSVIVGITV